MKIVRKPCREDRDFAPLREGAEELREQGYGETSQAASGSQYAYCLRK